MAFIPKTWVDEQIVYAADMNRIEQGIADAVSFTSQTLTDPQKTQARKNIAAAPDGFGLGANGYPNPYTVVTSATIDALDRSGLFWYKDDATPIYPDGYNSGTIGNLLHINGDTNNTLSARQIFYPYWPYGEARTLNISCMRMRNTDGEWQPWEWVNPPMALGVEYRTTERYLGKPVYVKVVDFGSMPNATTKTLSHGIANIAYPISAYGCTKDGWTSIPSVGVESLAEVIAVVSLTNTQIRVWCKDDWTTNKCYITIKYTKTTD